MQSLQGLGKACVQVWRRCCTTIQYWPCDRKNDHVVESIKDREGERKRRTDVQTFRNEGKRSRIDPLFGQELRIYTIAWQSRATRREANCLARVIYLSEDLLALKQDWFQFDQHKMDAKSLRQYDKFCNTIITITIK